jgi:hypothetical protein
LSDKDIQCLTIIEKYVFAGTYSGGIFVSSNNGDSWNSVNTDLPGSAVMAITSLGLDVFAGTYGSGVVWKRPLAEMVTSIDKPIQKNPYTFALEQNFPNPFNPTTIIRYRLHEVSDVNLSIFNLLGQKVATLISEKQNAGNYGVEWNAGHCAGGVYFYKISTAQGFTQTKKLIYLK